MSIPERPNSRQITRRSALFGGLLTTVTGFAAIKNYTNGQKAGSEISIIDNIRDQGVARINAKFDQIAKTQRSTLNGPALSQARIQSESDRFDELANFRNNHEEIFKTKTDHLLEIQRISNTNAFAHSLLGIGISIYSLWITRLNAVESYLRQNPPPLGEKQYLNSLARLAASDSTVVPTEKIPPEFYQDASINPEWQRIHGYHESLQPQAIRQTPQQTLSFWKRALQRFYPKR